MDLLDVQNKLTHCLELAVKANPVLASFGLAASSQVKNLGLTVGPEFIIFNPQYYIDNNIPDDVVIKYILDMHEDYIELMYPSELRSATTTTPQ